MRHYVIDNNRCLIHTDSPLLVGWEPCPDLKTLMAFSSNSPKEIGIGMRWKGAKLPAAVLQDVLGTIERFPHMETGYTLYYNMKENAWAVKCPQQYGGGASVRFKDDGDGMPAGYCLIGSIHTHPEMNAFWSSIDMDDQKFKYGVHFVFGLRNGHVAETLVSIFTPHGVYNQAWTDIAEDIDFTKTYDAREDWVRTINAQELKPFVYEPMRTAPQFIQADDHKDVTRTVYTDGKAQDVITLRDWDAVQQSEHNRRLTRRELIRYNKNMDKMRAAQDYLLEEGFEDQVASVLEDEYDADIVSFNKNEDQHDLAEMLDETLDVVMQEGGFDYDDIKFVLKSYGLICVNDLEEESSNKTGEEQEAPKC